MSVIINGRGVQEGILVADYNPASDLNDLINGQIVLVTDDTSNTPAPGNTWGVCIALGYASITDGGYRFQICFTINGEIYTRRKIDDEGWSSWTKLHSQ